MGGVCGRGLVTSKEQRMLIKAGPMTKRGCLTSKTTCSNAAAKVKHEAVPHAHF